MFNTNKNPQKQNLDVVGLTIELVNLTRIYGEKVKFLMENQSFKCDKCGYKETFTPREKILNGEYSVKPKQVAGVGMHSYPVYSYTAPFLVFSFHCECPNDHRVSSGIALEYALKFLREERDAKQGKKRPWETMVV